MVAFDVIWIDLVLYDVTWFKWFNTFVYDFNPASSQPASQPAHNMAGCRATWLAGCRAGWLAGWLAAWRRLAAWLWTWGLAGWLADTIGALVSIWSSQLQPAIRGSVVDSMPQIGNAMVGGWTARWPMILEKSRPGQTMPWPSQGTYDYSWGALPLKFHWVPISNPIENEYRLG